MKQVFDFDARHLADPNLNKFIYCNEKLDTKINLRIDLQFIIKQSLVTVIDGS